MSSTDLVTTKGEIVIGNPIQAIQGGTETGLRDMSWNAYRAFRGLNGSTIVHGRTSMLHLLDSWNNGIKDSEAKQFGRLIHCLAFEHQEVMYRYWPWSGVRRGKAYETYKTEALHEGAEVIRADGQYSLPSAVEATKRFTENPRVKKLIAAGQAEQTVLAVEHGLQCKGRLDWVSTSESTLTDLKTAARIEAEVFGRDFYRFGYDIKLGLYKRWLDRATDSRWPVEVIILESKPPYDVIVEPIPDSVLDNGVEKGMEIIEQVKHCIEEDRWPGVADEEGCRPHYTPYYIMQDETVEYSG